MLKQSSVQRIGFLLIVLWFLSCTDAKKGYEPTWESLRQHQIPEWMADAKFGIYGHWGPYAVAHDWPADEDMEVTRRCIYFAFQYKPDRDERVLFERHVGPVSEGYGYKDLIPRFKAEKFDPAEWAELVAASGARYAGLAVMHHDGYALWDSDLTAWNAFKTGPKRDVYGDYVGELRKRGLKIIATFHHLRTHRMWNTYYQDHLETARQKKWDLLDPAYRSLYWYESDFESDFLPWWEGLVKEVVDKYRPDIVWCDGGNLREGAVGEHAKNWLSYYFNKALEWGKEVSVHNKYTGLYGNNSYNFGEGFGVYTFENGRDRPDNLLDRPWEDDTSIGDAWPYYRGMTTKTHREIVVRLIHLVANNGGLLVSLTPGPDGSLSDEIRSCLLGVGDWLKQNGEAIFETRPWKIRNEGDLEKLKIIRKDGERILHIFEPDPEKLTWEDVRFTRRGNTLYAMCTGIPPTDQLTIESLSEDTKVSSENRIDSIELLGIGQVQWKRDERGLHIILPEVKPNGIALAFKIQVEGKLDQ